MEKEALDGAAGGPSREEAGGEDAGVVANQGVSGAEELGEVGENVVRERVPGTIHHEQPRLVAPRGRGLRDEVWRERIVKEFGGKRHGGGGGCYLRLALGLRASFFRCSVVCRASSVGRATLS